VDQEEGAPVYRVETFWNIGMVEVENGWEVQKSRKKKKVAPITPPCEIHGVNSKNLTREAQLEFCEADVRKPLVSAVRVAKAGNGIRLEANGGYVMNLATQERMGVRVENGVYVMDVQYDDETVDVITLDSGAGCNVWPKGRRAGKSSKLMPKKAGVGMIAANGTPIEYHGQRQVRFRGAQAESGCPGPR